LDGVPVFRVGLTDRAGIAGRYVGMLPVLVFLLSRRRLYDVILVTNLRILGAPSVLAAKLLSKPCILRTSTCGEADGQHLRSQAGDRRVLRACVRAYLAARQRILRTADAFVAISGAIEDEYLAAAFPADKIVRIPNGVDTVRFSPVGPEVTSSIRRTLQLPGDGTLFVYVGRLTTDKGVDTLIHAWKQVVHEHPDAHLLLVGPGHGLPLSCESHVRAFVETHDLTRTVTFAGPIDDVRAYLQCADIFVLPSRTEAFPNALIEAMACSLPVLASNVGGIPDAVVDGCHGRLVPPGCEEDLSAAALELARDVEARQALGRSARVRVEEHFTLRTMGDNYIEVLHGVPLLDDS
jgi:glycosyltransferase involved in cell wall biosynthesis